MMHANDPASPGQSPSEGSGSPDLPTAPGTSSSNVSGVGWRRFRRFLLRGAAFFGAALFLLAVLTAGAGWYTSRPEFCRSCHNMKPYFRSWETSSHKDVSCIKCHFPPGVGEKARGKLLGLVQLAKYVTQSEGPRPSAEIPDASCLRSGCHETRVLAGRVEFQGVSFDHRPHLETLRRGKKLRCTSCHGQMVQGSHMSVTTSTCFLCHFKEGLFNEGLGACTRCHQIPEEEFDLGGGVTFHHDLAYEKGVDCANCHGDLIQGKGEVPPERCGVCHNRQSDLVMIDDHEFMHQKHVTEHKVDCLECHLEIHHSIDEDRLLHAASDCTSCHPAQHHEQVKMIQGIGGRSISAETGSMAVARIACSSCHQVKKTSSTGTVLWKASIETCITCHDESDIERYQDYHKILRASLSDIESNIQRVHAALESAKLAADRLAAIRVQLNDLEVDLGFLRIGNDIHNIHYASTLTRALVDQLSALCRELKIDEPEIVLPKAREQPVSETTEAVEAPAK